MNIDAFDSSVILVPIAAIWFLVGVVFGHCMHRNSPMRQWCRRTLTRESGVTIVFFALGEGSTECSIHGVTFVPGKRDEALVAARRYLAREGWTDAGSTAPGHVYHTSVGSPRRACIVINGGSPSIVSSPA